MSAPTTVIGRLEPVHPDRTALQLCVATLDREDGCRGRSRDWSLVRCGFHEVVLCTRGSGQMRVDTEVIPVRPGTVLWLRPGLVHTPVPDVQGVAVCFTDEAAGESARWVSSTLWQLADADSVDVHGMVALIRAEYERYVFAPTGPSLARGDLLLTHLLQSLLLRLGQLSPVQAAGDATANTTAARFLELLDSHLAELHAVEQFAAQLHCSPRTLSRACTDAYGMTPKELVDARRAREARRLLAFTDLSVQAVGRRVGMDDPANFGRFFTRVVGVTPGAFRACR